jgi:hypothetical protein
VILANGSLVGPGIVIAATRYRTGLEPMVGKLGRLCLKADGRQA